MNDNDQDRSQTEGQEGIDRETELRNRENETGQQQGQPPSSEDRESELGQQGGQQNPAGTEGGGFVGSGKEDSSDYVTTGEQNPDFAEKGQGAQDTSPGQADIETGQSSDRDSSSEE